MLCLCCNDNQKRLCHIRGKFRGRGKRDNLVTRNAYILVGKRDWEGDEENWQPIDVGEYQERRKKSLQNMARNVSLEVAQTGRSITLEPMSAYDRRLVHLALSDNPEVVTQSAGSGADRQVVVSPADIDE